MARNRKIVAAVATVLALVVSMATWLFLHQSDEPSPVLQIPDIIPEDDDYEIPFSDFEERQLENEIVLPPGKLVVTQLRADYVDGTMRLIIPCLDLDATVGDNTSQAKLSEGPCLYKYGQIPNIYNTNVSIAGHRDLPPYPFYYLDEVGEGDNIYLVYEDKIFHYTYRETEVVEPTNWNLIRVHYDSRITLTTCTPLGTSRQRMIVIGELIEILDFSESYVFE